MWRGRGEVSGERGKGEWRLVVCGGGGWRLVVRVEKKGGGLGSRKFAEESGG